MASLNRARLARRLAVVTALVRKAVSRRETLRETARAGAVIRAALARTRIDPARVGALRFAAEAERALLGDSPALQRADAAFRAADRGLAASPDFAEKAARRAPHLAGRPPDDGASLVDWYAWSLAAADRPPQGETAPATPDRA